MADGVEDYAFVHATFKIGTGRTEEQKKKVCTTPVRSHELISRLSSPPATWHCR